METTDWQQDLVGQFVLHTGHRVAGRVEKHYKPGEYESHKDGLTEDEEGNPVPPTPVDSHVLGLDTGDAFLAEDPEAFLKLEGNEAAFVENLRFYLKGFLYSAIALAKHFGVSPLSAKTLICCALNDQARLLEAEVLASTPPPVDPSEVLE